MVVVVAVAVLGLMMQRILEQLLRLSLLLLLVLVDWPGVRMLHVVALDIVIALQLLELLMRLSRASRWPWHGMCSCCRSKSDTPKWW